uniref:Transmembrane protein n=1 Tax=Fagus sylvatica TaxID=28930 RepID=A0A2N9HFI5_FAGSY
MGFDFMGLWLWVCRRGFVVAWVCGYGFADMGLWWIGGGFCAVCGGFTGMVIVSGDSVQCVVVYGYGGCGFAVDRF